MAKVSIDYKRSILDSARGRVFRVTFIKLDGTVRTVSAKKRAAPALASGDLNIVQKSTQADKPNLYNMVDLIKYKVDPKKSYVSCDLNRLLSCKVDGVTYTFDQE